jgi:D-3-phosphoglycerate dehydrogenase
MRIQFYDPFISGDNPPGLEATAVSLDSVAADSDIVCVACNLTPENRHLIDAAFLARMKSEASFINISRGPLVDEGALAEALADGRIAGAALDVFEVEPLPATSRLRPLENVVLGSHNANNGLAAVERVHKTTLENLYRYLV